MKNIIHKKIFWFVAGMALPFGLALFIVLKYGFKIFSEKEEKDFPNMLAYGFFFGLTFLCVFSFAYTKIYDNANKEKSSESFQKLLDQHMEDTKKELDSKFQL